MCCIIVFYKTAFCLCQAAVPSLLTYLIFLLRVLQSDSWGTATHRLRLVCWVCIRHLYQLTFLASGYEAFGSVDYEGRVYVDPGTRDDDFIGFVFSYQNESRFYLVSWKRHVYFQLSGRPVPGRPGVAIKVQCQCSVLLTVVYCCLGTSYYRKFTQKPEPASCCMILFGNQETEQTKYSCWYT